jgi:hypothetical protein
MNTDQMTGLVRILVPALCAWLAAKGFDWFGDEGVVAQIGAVVVGIAALVWSYFRHTNASNLKAAAQIDPTIKIEVPNHIADSDPAIAKLVDTSPIHNINRERRT